MRLRESVNRPGHWLIILSKSECGVKGNMFQRELSGCCKVQLEAPYMLVAKSDLHHVRRVAANVYGPDAIQETPF